MSAEMKKKILFQYFSGLKTSKIVFSPISLSIFPWISQVFFLSIHFSPGANYSIIPVNSRPATGI